MRARFRDFAIYLIVGSTYVAGVSMYSKYESSNAEAMAKWGGLTGMTAILFGYAIQDFWRFRRRRSFWIVMSTLICLHLTIFAAILVAVGTWKVLWFVFAFPVENLAIDWILIRTGHVAGGRSKC